MLNDFNAWIHSAAKRYYGMIGDGQCGTDNGEMTKRGYVMAHFAKYITGMTRIDAQWNDNAAQPLEGSAYLSQTGDTVVAVLINPSDNERIVTFDLPFYTQRGRMQTTTPSKNLSPKDLRQKTETCRPQVAIAAQSVATLIFARSRDRQPSQMTGSINRFDRIDDMTCTNSAFGTTYKMSGKTLKFDHSNPLVSARTNAANGYIQLTDRFDQLVLNIKKVTSTLNYTSAKTTLCYVNAKGQVATHDYGELDLNRRENFNLTLDLSPKTLPDGCRGIISITNNNWSSTLTITFGDVYLSNGGHYAATLSGQYGADDSYLLDYTADGSCTSIDMTSVTALPASFDWLNGNRVVYVSDGNNVSGSNIVIGSECQQLLLADDGSDFRPAKQFNAAEAQLTLTVDGYRLLMLPFAAELPQGVYAYSIGTDMTLQPLTVIPAHQPVLVEAQGAVVLKGSGAVSFARSPLADLLRGTYTQIPLYEGDYLLGKQNGEWGFVRQNTSATLTPFGVYAQLSSTASFIPLNLSVTGITDVRQDADAQSAPLYNVMGQRVGKDHKGIVIRKGVKIVNKK
jgi:glucuronoarabinoxylan endo-1,4-beta-xylanase